MRHNFVSGLRTLKPKKQKKYLKTKTKHFLEKYRFFQPWITVKFKDFNIK